MYRIAVVDAVEEKGVVLYVIRTQYFTDNSDEASSPQEVTACLHGSRCL